MKTVLSLLIVVFTFLGILDASYVTWSRFSGVLPPCKPPFACETVLNSSWSKIGPVPLSVLGILFYSTFFLIAALSVLEVKAIKKGQFSVPIPALIILLGCFGAGFSLYLVFIMGVILKAWCLYCLLSALNCGIVFLLSCGVWRKSDFPTLFRKESDALHI
jgi:uncharacterized membrane protein